MGPERIKKMDKEQHAEVVLYLLHLSSYMLSIKDKMKKKKTVEQKSA